MKPNSKQLRELKRLWALVKAERVTGSPAHLRACASFGAYAKKLGLKFWEASGLMFK